MALMHDGKPAIPEATAARWQRIVDILARIAQVPAGLIMKMTPPDHRVFTTSRTPGNPYTTDTSFRLNTGLYCDKVMADRQLLVVPDAAQDPDWDSNPDLEHGMVFYMGFPLQWPDGSLFGTICVLDRKNNENARDYADLLHEFKAVVEGDLTLLIELAERERVEQELQRAHDELESRVAMRTAELTEANTALKVLLQRMEDAKRETEEQVLRNIDEQIVPYMEKLQRAPLGAKEQSYLSLLEANLQRIAAGFPGRLSSAFSKLTPTELEVAKLITQGKSTKEIATVMATASSTVDFHRNNIRKKVGLRNSGVSLRSYLSNLA